MKYYKDSQNQVYAYAADGSQDKYIQPSLIPITKEEADVIRFPPPTQAQQAQAIRAERDVRIRKADYAINMAEDAGLDTTALRAYRQALRDVPQQPGFPEAVNWPEQPEGGVQAAAEKEGMTETQAAAVPQTA